MTPCTAKPRFARDALHQTNKFHTGISIAITTKMFGIFCTCHRHFPYNECFNPPHAFSQDAPSIRKYRPWFFPRPVHWTIPTFLMVSIRLCNNFTPSGFPWFFWALIMWSIDKILCMTSSFSNMVFSCQCWNGTNLLTHNKIHKVGIGP